MIVMQARAVSFGPGPDLLGPAILIIVIFVLAVWFASASSAAMKGERLDQPNRMAQLYGYTVCLICVVVGIVSLSSIVGAAFDRAHPLQNEFGFGASLASFEAYKATRARDRMYGPPEVGQTPDTASDVTLRARYDALVQERTAATQYRTSKSFVLGGIMLAFAVVLFLVHWRWVSRALRAAPSAG